MSFSSNPHIHSFSGVVDLRDRLGSVAGQAEEHAYYGLRTPHSYVEYQHPAPQYPGTPNRPRAISNGNGWFVFIGRLDGREELARSLGQQHEEDVPDEELACQAFERWQEDAPQHMLGDFAFAAWRENERRLIFAADVTGIHTVYHCRDGDRIRFATSLRELLRDGVVPRSLDENYLVDCLSLNLGDDDTTAFRHVKKTVAATCCVLSSGKSQTLQFHQFDPERRIKLSNDNEYVEAAWELLQQAVSDRMRNSNPTVIIGSSGLDSACIAAAAASTGKQVHYLTAIPDMQLPTAQMHPTVRSEQHLVKVLAKAFPNLQAQFFAAPSDSNWSPDWPLPIEVGCSPHRGPMQLAWLSGPFLHSSSLGAKIQISGTVGNYTLTWDGFRQLPSLFRSGQYRTLAREIVKGSAGRPRGFARLVWKELIQPMRGGRYRYSDLQTFSAVHPRAIDEQQLLQRMKHRGNDTNFVRSEDSRLWRIEALRRSRGRRAEISNILAGLYGMEHAAPLADRRLVEFCLAIPDDQYLRNGNSRWLARRLLRAAGVPVEISENRRRGYQHPEWHSHLSSVHASMISQVAHLRTSPTASRLLDLDRLDSILNNWPREPAAAERRRGELNAVLCAGLSVGAFIAWAESGS